MHMSEAFPRTYDALGDALDSLGFRIRDAWVVEMLVAELKAWERAEDEIEHLIPFTVECIFKGDIPARSGVLPTTRTNWPASCALAETLLGRFRDEPKDPRFLA